MKGRSPVRAVIRAFGFACLMTAAGLAGYTAWLLWGTGLETARAQDQLRVTSTPLFQHPTPVDGERPLTARKAYAAIVIPSIDIDFIVVQGPNDDSYRSYGWTETLKMGPAHYPDTADPWDGTGRVGIAGHRTTYLHPFLNLDRVRPGATIELITRHGTYTYEVDRNFVLSEGTAGKVLTQTRKPTLVLTTCNPKYSSSQRLIITATLVSGPVGA
jgi:LPXTG-site transpeptidase (sortase) family protein